MMQQLLIEIGQDDDGYFVAFIIDVSDDCVLHVSNTYPSPEDAETAGRRWIDANE